MKHHLSSGLEGYSCVDSLSVSWEVGDLNIDGEELTSSSSMSRI